MQKEAHRIEVKKLREIEVGYVISSVKCSIGRVRIGVIVAVIVVGFVLI